METRNRHAMEIFEHKNSVVLKLLYWIYWSSVFNLQDIIVFEYFVKLKTEYVLKLFGYGGLVCGYTLAD